MKRNRFVLS
ncbi:hypothetical protein LINPERHAP1_LOCUS30164 [Linum perenne]